MNLLSNHADFLEGTLMFLVVFYIYLTFDGELENRSSHHLCNPHWKPKGVGHLLHSQGFPARYGQHYKVIKRFSVATFNEESYMTVQHFEPFDSFLLQSQP